MEYLLVVISIIYFRNVRKRVPKKKPVEKPELFVIHTCFFSILILIDLMKI